MKIAFTSTGKNWDSPVDSVFGRAEGFLLFDEEKDDLSWYSNDENRKAGHGAGIQAGQNVAGLGAKVLITGGDVGPKATDVLKKAGIEIYASLGKKSVKEAYDAFHAGELNDNRV